MTRNEELKTVILLACLTEDRTDAEQRALISLAWECDVEHNKLTVGNRGAYETPQDLVSVVQETRDLQEGQRLQRYPKRWQERWETWRSERPMFLGRGHQLEEPGPAR